MRKRLPVTTGGTEATRATVVIAALHVQSPERRAAPARPVGDHAEVVPGMPLAPVALPLLRVQVQKRGGDHLGVELGRREVLGGHAHLGGAVALRDAQGVVDERRRVDLHGDRIGVGRVEAIEVEDLLEVEEHPLDPPAGGIEVQRLLGAQAGGGQHIGEQLVPRAAAAPPDVAQQLPRGRGARASLHQPVLQAAALHAAAPKSAVPYRRSPTTRVSGARSARAVLARVISLAAASAEKYSWRHSPRPTWYPPSKQPGRTTARSSHNSFNRCAMAARREPSNTTTAPKRACTGASSAA